MKKNLVQAVVFLIVFFLSSCQLIDDIFDGKKDKNVSFVADISGDTEFDLLAYAEEDQSYFAVKLRNNYLPEYAVFKPDETSEPYPIWYDQNGFPERMVVNGFIFSLSNFSAESFDMGIISPEGEISIVREIPVPEEYQEYIRLKSFSRSDGIRWASHIAGTVACAASIVGGTASMVATFGISSPVAVTLIGLGCGATALSIGMEFFPEEIASFVNLPAASVSAFSTTLSCITPEGVISCVGGVLSSFLLVASEAVEEHENEVELTDAALESGYGDIQVTLKWNSSADIDLYVQDPNEELIWFGNKISVSGGWLDRDDIDGEGPENIFWGKNQAPEGNYLVYVKHYSGGYADYFVLVQAFGRMKQFDGRIGPGQSIFITDFSRNHLKTGSIYPVESFLPTTGK